MNSHSNGQENLLLEVVMVMVWGRKGSERGKKCSLKDYSLNTKPFPPHLKTILSNLRGITH
jgi:hypothetical protein